MAKTLLSGASMTMDDVAAELGIHVESVRKMVKSGRLVAYRVGSRGVRITRQALEKYQTDNILQPRVKV